MKRKKQREQERHFKMKFFGFGLIPTFLLMILLSGCERPDAAPDSAVCAIWKSTMWEADGRADQLAELNQREAFISACPDFVKE